MVFPLKQNLEIKPCQSRLKGGLFPNSVITVFPIYDEYIPHRNILQRCIRENEYGIIKSSFIEYMLQADRGTHTPSLLKDGRKPMQGGKPKHS